MEGWVGLVGWSVIDILPTKWSHVTHWSGKVRQPKADVLTTKPRRQPVVFPFRLKRQFRQLLQDTQLVGPGKSLSEVAIFFLGRECFNGLTEKEKQEIYDEHQSGLRSGARRDFLELLLENSESLAHFENSQVTTDDIQAINTRLQTEPRQALHSE